MSICMRHSDNRPERSCVLAWLSFHLDTNKSQTPVVFSIMFNVKVISWEYDKSALEPSGKGVWDNSGNSGPVPVSDSIVCSVLYPLFRICLCLTCHTFVLQSSFVILCFTNYRVTVCTKLACFMNLCIYISFENVCTIYFLSVLAIWNKFKSMDYMFVKVALTLSVWEETYSSVAACNRLFIL